MSTFTEENTNKVPESIPPPLEDPKLNMPESDKPQAIAGTDANSAWSIYLNSLNAKYQQRIKKMAQSPNYTLTLRYEDGREERQVYTRKKLLQWQFDEIEDLRADAAELGAKGEARKAQKALSHMYHQAATYLLFNTKREQMMTEEEYNHCVFQEVRPALDSAMLIGLISDPN